MAGAKEIRSKIAKGIEDAFQLAFDFVVIATGLVNLLHQRSVITVDVLKQKQYAPMSVAQQSLVLFAAERGYLADVELAKRLISCISGA
jgi:F0F1-type ATP synthase alpha subunit